MSAIDKVFAGSIPELYEQWLVPLIFEPYGRDLARRIGETSPARILEIAAGTGAATREIARVLAPDERKVVTDLNQPMLDRAKEQLGADPRIQWRQADALSLPFRDGEFDVVACQFGAMFFPDKVQGYREARRVLRRGGRYVFSVWDRIGDNEFADVVTQALAELLPEDPPRFLARTPHGYCDAETIRAQLSDAGFTDVQLEAVDERSRARSFRDPAIAYCQGTPLRSEIEARAPDGLQRATEHAATAISRRFGDGVVDGKIRALVVSAGA